MLPTRDGKLSILRFEGLVTVAYLDGKDRTTGKPKYSIGAGHGGANSGDTISVEEALRLLDKDIAERAGTVSRTLKVPVAPHQFDALLSAYYQGGNLKLRPLAEAINAGDLAKASWLFPTLASDEHGTIMAGLLGRRLIEQKMFDKGEYRPDRFEIPLFRANPHDKATKREVYHVTDKDFA